MMQLPHEMRDTLVEQLDEYLEAQTGNPEPEAVSAYVVELISTVADEMKIDEAEEILLRLESSGEMEAALVEVLEEAFESDDEFEYTGEEIVSLVEKVCDVEWTTKEDEDEVAAADADDDDPDGFFEEVVGEEEDDL
jgi:hypothetical protein